MNRVIYTPDGEPIRVEWYISDGKAVGVEAISTGWIARPVGPAKRTGFGPPGQAVLNDRGDLVRVRSARWNAADLLP